MHASLYVVVLTESVSVDVPIPFRINIESQDM